jgi:hypothetical protein
VFYITEAVKYNQQTKAAKQGKPGGDMSDVKDSGQPKGTARQKQAKPKMALVVVEHQSRVVQSTLESIL